MKLNKSSISLVVLGLTAVADVGLDDDSTLLEPDNAAEFNI